MPRLKQSKGAYPTHFVWPHGVVVCSVGPLPPPRGAYDNTESLKGLGRNELKGVLCNQVFIYRYMRPEGPWERLAAALADSSRILHDRVLSSTGMIGPSEAPNALHYLELTAGTCLMWTPCEYLGPKRVGVEKRAGNL